MTWEGCTARYNAGMGDYILDYNHHTMFKFCPLQRQMVRDAQKLKVVEVVEKEDRKARPSGLNTVELLKVGGV